MKPMTMTGEIVGLPLDVAGLADPDCPGEKRLKQRRENA